MLSRIDRPSLFIYTFEKNYIGKGDETHGNPFLTKDSIFITYTTNPGICTEGS